MFESDPSIAKRYAASRPGLTLVAIVDAALPVTQLQVDVLAQERQALPLLDEFTIRLAAMGVRDQDQMASILGVDLKLAETSIVDQLAADNLRRAPGTKTLVELTPQGRVMAADLEALRPVQRALPVIFDRLTWEAAPYPPEVLVQRREAEEAGWVILPPLYRRRVLPSDITVASLNRLITEDDSKRGIEVLVVNDVSPKKHRHLPVKLLIFTDTVGKEVQLGTVVEGRLSPAHERGLIALGGHSALGISVAEPAESPELPPDIEALRSLETEHVGTVAGNPESRASVATPPPFRGISVHDHPELLREALTESNRRLLIISPWVRASVVDESFLRSLERLLRRNVRVHIAYGIGSDDRGSDQRALSALSTLAGKFASLFTFARLRNCHAKILISDAMCIITSFNWLSFKGDPDRTYRMEEGFLVQSEHQVDGAYEKFVRMIDDQRADKQ